MKTVFWGMGWKVCEQKPGHLALVKKDLRPETADLRP